MTDFDDDYDDEDDLDLSTLPDDELVEQMHDDLYNGLKEEVAEGTQILLDRDWSANRVLNEALVAGMTIVGIDFRDGILFVPEVLMSANSMKAGMKILKPLLSESDEPAAGSMVIGTVKGDIHDIGKNLVEIILKNNGFDVINLGIKVHPHTLIAAIEKHKPDLLGLSGLLVKSTREMVITAEELKAAGHAMPLLVGGAALTRSFSRRRIAPAYDGPVVYAPDAMSGLELAIRLMDPEQRPSLEEELCRDDKQYVRPEKEPVAPVSSPGGSDVTPLNELPEAPDLARHLLNPLNLDEVWSFINPAMLYNKHLVLKGRFERLLTQGDHKALFVKSEVDVVKEECLAGAMTAAAVYRFFAAEPDGERLNLYLPGRDEPAGVLSFPRQQSGAGLCLVDYVRRPLADGRRDTVCLMVTGAGAGIRDLSTHRREEGAYLKSHVLQALALETAESAMEWLHAQVRGLWGCPDLPGVPMKDLFKTRYRGRRYSFGYPACPDLSGQRQLFAALRPEEIGVELTEGDMMDPEASVSALVFHHQDARYFGV